HCFSLPLFACGTLTRLTLAWRAAPSWCTDEVVQTVRVYLPATMATLAALRRHGRVELASGHAVTPMLREWFADADPEELAYTAFSRAAQDSLGRLHADPTVARRRVVISADAQVEVEDQPLGSSLVRLRSPVPLSAVAAIHVDG